MASSPILSPIGSQEEHDELLEIAEKCPICDTYSDCTSSTHKCKICKKVCEVHEARHCKELCVCGSGNDHSLDDHVCFECGKKGFQHLRSQCPYACPCDRKGHTSEEHVCVVCEEVGFSHMNDRCPKMCPCGCRNPKDEHKCSICKLVGFSHMEWMCPERCICESSLQLPATHHYKKHGEYKAGYAWEKRTIPPQEGSTMEDMVATRNANDASKCPCGQPHSADMHICGCCNRKGFHHYFYECPKLCPCGSNQHSVDKHRCKKCHKVGFSHFTKDCPSDPHHIYHDIQILCHMQGNPCYTPCRRLP